MAEKDNKSKTLKRFTVGKKINSRSNKITKKIEKSERGKKQAVQKERKFKENELAKKLRRAWSLFPYILPIVTFVLANGSYVVGEGNVGCLYVGSLCLSGLEFCYDDLVFGKCLSKSGVEMEDIDRAPVTEEQSRILATMLEELQGADLGWDHPFVQCQIQGTLFAMRRRTQLPPNLCANLAPDPEIISPQSPLAFVRFTSPDNSREYNPEINYQPFDQDEDFTNHYGFVPSAQRRRIDNMELLTELARRSDILPQEEKRIIQKSLTKTEPANHVKSINNGFDLRKMLLLYENGELSPLVFDKNYVHPYTNKSYDGQIYDNLILQRNSKRSDNGINFSFFREISRNKQIPLNRKSRLMSPSLEYYNYPKKSKPFKLNTDNDEIHFPVNLFKLRPDDQKHFNQIDQMGVYTEGGFLIPSDQNNNNKDRKKDARTLLANMLGFTRHERLDVKKPGPPIRSNSEIKNTDVADNPTQKISRQEDISSTMIKAEQIKKAKKVVQDHSAEDHAPYSVDTEYAFVIMKHPIDSWADGVRIVNALANTLQMNFTHPRVDSHEVSFRVEPNPDKKSAVDVAKYINADRFKSNIYRRFGITIVRSGVGNKVKYDPENEVVQASKIEQLEHGPDVTHIMAYMFAGAGAAAALVIIVVLFLIRRHDKNRYKLGGLQSSTTGNESCSKDYQELCRARMATKGQSQDVPSSSGRISALTKDNERPPSSRSSTSSWSEEPALTNMDISTGHMVLSYMEDHLRNKGRLQREWEALCRYEAEPSARDAALQEECAVLNRTNAPLPYDHSRVVLNHLANAEGLDYINASTITDHDPRAPAYVASQGPLPTTLAHFWQMIWEQGAVVIVALCRLQENNEQVCARYWPEEGAEVYHIYEVHLVSEHIWCDDYLVRSFYLKNLRTSETRTVTQFHFLSWPQGGIPSQAKALLEFRRKVNKSYRGRSCPIVVHDSNGAGRTGAYILLDLVLGRMNKGAREIDIAATLEHLRDQRAGLVATRQQFEFVLMAVAEEVHAILKALPNQNEKRDLDKEAVKEEDESTVKRGKKKTEKVNDSKDLSNSKPMNLKNDEK